MDGTTSKDMYEQCCRKALLESLVSSSLMNDIYGSINTNSLVRETIDEYNKSNKLIDDFGTKLVQVLIKDLDDDHILEGIKKHEPELYEDGKRSILRTIEKVDTILSGLSSSFEEQLRFILYFECIKTTCDPFDFKKLRMNLDRIAEAKKSQDLNAALKDQFNQVFEQIYRPYAKDFTSLITRYPGMNSETAYRTVEDMLCIDRTYLVNDECRSDIREIRNAFSHEQYSIGEKIIITLKDGSTAIYSSQEIMFRLSMMYYKCMYLNMILPLINIEILRRMAHRFSS